MLERAKEKNIPGNIEYLHADVESIPLPDNFCDAVVCFSTFPHFPDKAKAVREMVRVLRRGGKLFIAHFDSYQDINARHREIGGAVEHDTLPSPKGMRELLCGAGLKEVSVVNRRGKYMARGVKWSIGFPCNWESKISR